MTIVVGYVDSPVGRAALDAAIREAALRTTDVIVVGYANAPGDSLGARSALEGVDQVRSSLEKVRAEVDDHGVRVTTRATTGFDDPGEAILSVVDEVSAELVVVGIRRRSPVGKLLLGSVTQKIMLQAPCDVLAVRDPADKH